MGNRPSIFCLTPTRNEEWVIDRFLKSTCLWADYIIIIDQMSTDNTRKIIKKYPKTILIENNTEKIDEPERQRLLIQEARKFEGPKLLIALDADEIFSSEALQPKSWTRILNCSPGTIFCFQWANILPDKKNYWKGYHLPYGYMDDGIDHTNSSFFHGTRLPAPTGNPVVNITEFMVIHYPYIDPARNASKQRWYQCLELDNPSIAHSPLEIYRKYHQDIIFMKQRKYPIPQKWIEMYNNYNIDILSTNIECEYWFDSAVNKLIMKHGAKYYHKLDIWTDVFKKIDPRSPIDKIVQKYLRITQPHYFSKVRKVDEIVKKIFHY